MQLCTIFELKRGGLLQQGHLFYFIPPAFTTLTLPNTGKITFSVDIFGQAIIQGYISAVSCLICVACVLLGDVGRIFFIYIRLGAG